MISFSSKNIRGVLWQYYFLMVLSISRTDSQQLFKSRIIFGQRNTQFSPANFPAQLLSTTSTASLKLCAIACNANVRCRVLDFDVVQPRQCRLFEGDPTTMGTISPSASSNSTVGIVQLSTDLFAGYGHTCLSVCQQWRYLTCGNNSICQCQPHTYWNGSMCAAQTPVLGAPCQQNMSMCRTDLNYTCLPFNQCGPLSVLSGTTIGNSTTYILGSSFTGLSLPLGLIADIPPMPGYILVADGFNNQIVRLSESNSSSNSVVARIWIGGGLFSKPSDMFLDITRGNNLYVSDTLNNRVLMFTGMQSISPLPKLVAGTGIAGSGASQLSAPRGIVLDRQGNAYIADYSNHRVMRYTPNATIGTMIAGTGTAGSDLRSLDCPMGLFLDKSHSWLYVCDTNNHRVQRFSLNSSLPSNGTTVAGGNGQGSGSNQLNQPYGIWVSNKTGAAYVADTYSHRIQRWSPGATTGLTIAGSSNGISGSSATTFNAPSRLTASTNETFLYVSDGYNQRVQRFQLI